MNRLIRNDQQQSTAEIFSLVSDGLHRKDSKNGRKTRSLRVLLAAIVDLLPERIPAREARAIFVSNDKRLDHAGALKVVL
jgi:hypothetical protein